jgi:hypothetical protein
MSFIPWVTKSGATIKNIKLKNMFILKWIWLSSKSIIDWKSIADREILRKYKINSIEETFRKEYKMKKWNSFNK